MDLEEPEHRPNSREKFRPKLIQPENSQDLSLIQLKEKEEKKEPPVKEPEPKVEEKKEAPK